jgi:hypothetical protein
MLHRAGRKVVGLEARDLAAASSVGGTQVLEVTAKLEVAANSKDRQALEVAASFWGNEACKDSS